MGKENKNKKSAAYASKPKKSYKKGPKKNTPTVYMSYGLGPKKNTPTVYMSYGLGPKNVRAACSEIIETQVNIMCPICNTKLTPLGVADITPYHDLTCIPCEEHFEMKTMCIKQGENVTEDLTLHGGNYNAYLDLSNKPTLITVGYSLRELSPGLYAIHIIDVRYYPSGNYAVYQAYNGSSQIICLGSFTFASAKTDDCGEIKVDCRDTDSAMDLEREDGPYGEIVPNVHYIDDIMPSPRVSYNVLFDRPTGPVMMDVW